jgi:hypothetical protein
VLEQGEEVDGVDAVVAEVAPRSHLLPLLEQRQEVNDVDHAVGRGAAAVPGALGDLELMRPDIDDRRLAVAGVRGTDPGGPGRAGRAANRLIIPLLRAAPLRADLVGCAYIGPSMPGTRARAARRIWMTTAR